MRSDLIWRLQEAVRNWQPECVLHSFGSYAAGLYLPNADMDMVVISPQFMATHIPHLGRRADLNSLAKHLHKSGIALGQSIEVIAKAKVPIVKFRDQATDLRVDLSFDNLTGVVANQTFHEWKAQFPAMPIIVTIIKQFLLMRGMNEVVNGGLGGFSVTCMVTSLLQNMPRVQTGEMVPEQNLGDILLEFLDFYGNRFDYTRTAISMNPPCFVEKVSLGIAAPCNPLCLLRVLLKSIRPHCALGQSSKNSIAWPFWIPTGRTTTSQAAPAKFTRSLSACPEDIKRYSTRWAQRTARVCWIGC